MHVLITLWSVLAAWRWADWSKWREFHPTILYLSAMDLLYFLLTTDYSMWTIQSNIGISERSVALLYTFIVFPCTVMLYLSRYPHQKGKQILHISKWILIYITVEWIGWLRGTIYYDHGWSLGWSFLFLLVMFPMLRLHHTRPLLAYIASIIFVVFLLNWFDVPWRSVQ